MQLRVIADERKTLLRVRAGLRIEQKERKNEPEFGMLRPSDGSAGERELRPGGD